MRRVLLGVALAALLTILVTAPAGAVPPNEILIAKNLQRLGIVPSYATPTMARAAAHALAATGNEYPVKPAVGTAAQSKALGSYLSARVVTGKGASTYATNALVLLVEFGTGAWPDGDSTRPLSRWSAPRPGRAPGRGRQRDVLAGRLQPDALPADALRQLVSHLRRLGRPDHRRREDDQGRRRQRAAVRDPAPRQQRRHHAQLLP